MGLNILEDYIPSQTTSSTLLSGSVNRPTITSVSPVVPGRRQSAIDAKQKRGSLYPNEPSRPDRSASGDALRKAEARVEKNKIITWADGDIICDQDRLAELIRPKELDSGEAVEKPKKSSPFISALEHVASVPKNPFLSFSKFATTVPVVNGRDIRNEFNICVSCDEAARKAKASEIMRVRFVKTCKVYDVMGLALFKYQTALDSGNGLDKPQLPSVSVDDYELKALIDEDDDDDIEPMDVDPNTLALNYAMDLYMLRPREILESQASSEKSPFIAVNIHMLGKAVTKTMQLTDRNTPLQYIYDEGMRFFFGGKPNYGPPYALVPYNEQERVELDLEKTLADFQYRSFLLRRTKCSTSTLKDSSAFGIPDDTLLKVSCSLVNASNALRKKGSKYSLSCSKELIALDQILSAPSQPVNRLASWDPDQIIDYELNPPEGTVKLLVYLKPVNIHTRMTPNALQDSTLIHTNIRWIILKLSDDSNRTSMEQFAAFLAKDKFVEISPYQKLWDFQSDQNKLKIVGRSLPF
ncbi:uncharacterized protein LOC134839445 [Symsagittifera roscoffensis]|uniref:uncharacterized protein LOC134839445 n=1 Tax=Symsagittifera roscoffensis TaxID=84072 RepID=UPI00307CC5C4